MNKIKNWFYRLLYALPFGLKGADEEILGSNSGNADNGSSIVQKVEDKTVFNNLINGTVTQSVEELRYRMYKVDEESQNYEYLGNGIAVKKEEKPIKKNKHKFKFTQRNRLLVNGVLDELERVDSYGEDNYALEIMYSVFPKFQLGEFADRIIVNADIKEESFKTTLVFSTIPNPYNQKSKPFVNELLKLKDVDLKSEYAVSHNMFLGNMTSISFSTYKASGEENFVNYSFLGECTPLKVEFKDNECFITYKWGDMIRLPLGKLSEKYSSQTMQYKYENHVEKNVDSMLEPVKLSKHCIVCGKEYENSKIPDVCDECYNKMLH